MTSERDAHPDEGTIHAWLDRQLDDAESDVLEAHLQRCDECAERVAEARGLIAGASRVVAALDLGEPVAASTPAFVRTPAVAGDPAVAAGPIADAAGPAVLPATRVRGLPTFRLTPSRMSIAAVLVVAVALAIVHENQRPTSRLASQAAESATITGAAPAAPLSAAPTVAPGLAPSVASSAPAAAAAPLDSTAAVRVAAARTFAKAQRETTVNADLARVAQVPTPAASAPMEQTIAAARAADSMVAAPTNALRGAVPGVSVAPAAGNAAGTAAGTAAGAAAKSAYSAAPAAPASPTAVEAPQCFRVESATGTSATWGPVPLPFILALDAPATRATARVLTVAGQEADARAVFERRGNDSLLFTLRRIGFTGTLALGAPGEVRAGVMRSAPTSMTLSEVVVTSAAAESASRRSLRGKAAAQTRAGAPAPVADQQAATAAPAVPVVVKKVGCATRG